MYSRYEHVIYSNESWLKRCAGSEQFSTLDLHSVIQVAGTYTRTQGTNVSLSGSNTLFVQQLRHRSVLSQTKHQRMMPHAISTGTHLERFNHIIYMQ